MTESDVHEIVTLVGELWPACHPESGTRGFAWHPRLIGMFRVDLGRVYILHDEAQRIITQHRYKGERPPAPGDVLGWLREWVDHYDAQHWVGPAETERREDEGEGRMPFGTHTLRYNQSDSFATMTEPQRDGARWCFGEDYGRGLAREQWRPAAGGTATEDDAGAFCSDAAEQGATA